MLIRSWKVRSKLRSMFKWIVLILACTKSMGDCHANESSSKICYATRDIIVIRHAKGMSIFTLVKVVEPKPNIQVH